MSLSPTTLPGSSLVLSAPARRWSPSIPDAISVVELGAAIHERHWN
jgi:hypothetical protein